MAVGSSTGRAMLDLTTDASADPTTDPPMPLIACTEARHADAILAIFNEAIANSTALYDYRPRAPDTMAPWFATKRSKGFPVIGVEDDDGRLLGFASYGTFRAWPAYKYAVEHSIYIHVDHRGQGLGRLLLEALIEQARADQVHTLIGGIDAANAGSITLHTRLGFQHAGTIRQAGFKFGRWLDLAFFQRILETPTNPVDGD
jgi:phosphinothricin acetyltransferase